MGGEVQLDGPSEMLSQALIIHQAVWFQWMRFSD
jgi:hypothetical protein